MDEDRVRWDERYADRAGGPATLSTVPEALGLLDADSLARFPAGGLALDIACGAGGQSLWLAERGFDVVALDVSPVAIDLTVDAARERGLSDRIDARVHDLDSGLPADVVGVSMIICQRFRGRNLYPQIIEALAPDGIAFVTVLSAVGLDATPGEFHAPAGELDEAFGGTGVDVLASAERDGVASIVVRRH